MANPTEIIERIKAKGTIALAMGTGAGLTINRVLAQGPTEVVDKSLGQPPDLLVPAVSVCVVAALAVGARLWANNRRVQMLVPHQEEADIWADRIETRNIARQREINDRVAAEYERKNKITWFLADHPDAVDAAEEVLKVRHGESFNLTTDTYNSEARQLISEYQKNPGKFERRHRDEIEAANRYKQEYQ